MLNINELKEKLKKEDCYLEIKNWPDKFKVIGIDSRGNIITENTDEYDIRIFDKDWYKNLSIISNKKKVKMYKVMCIDKQGDYYSPLYYYQSLEEARDKLTNLVLGLLPNTEIEVEI